LSLLKKRGLFFKISLMVLLLFIIGIGTITVVSIREQTQTIKGELIEKNKHISIHVASSAKNAFWSLNWHFVERQMKEETDSEDIIFLAIIKPNGEIYMSSGDKEYEEELLSAPLVSPETQIVEDAVYSKSAETTKRIITPIKIGNEQWSLIMVLSLKQVEDARQAILKTTIGYGSVIFFLVMVLSFFFSRAMYRRISKLMQGTEEIAKGNLEYKIDEMGRDELGALATAFNAMTEDLKKTTTSRDLLAKEMAEREQAEKTLLKSEERYRSVFGNTGAATVIIEEDMTISMANSEFEKLSGYSKEEVEGKIKWIEFVVKEDLEKMKEYHGKRREKEREAPKEYEFRFVDRQGNIKEILNKIAMFPGTKRSIASLIDITTRKQAEEALRENEEKYRQLVNHAPSGILELDIIRNKLISLNDVACELTGYAKEELLSMNLFDLLTEDSKRLFKERVNKISEGGQINESVEYKIKRKDGQELFCIINSRTTFDEDGRPIRSTIVANDITDLRRSEEEKMKLEAQFIQAQKMEAIGRLAGGVAHDFNNLMTSVIGNANLALMNLKEENLLCECLEEIEKAGERAASLTRQLLAFSRKQIFKPEVLDLNNGIREIYKMLGRLIGEDIELKTILEPELGKVNSDSGHIDQVIMNLAVNARDAMPRGGKLTIETTNVELDKDYFRTHGVEEHPGPYVMLAVSDTGIGMDKETRSHIFEPFFTTKKKGEGTGLGLSTVYGIVKQSGGFIWVYSEPGGGSTFKFYLPRVGSDAEPVKKERTPMEDFSGFETVLIVEDNNALRNLARKILHRYGYRVLDAKQGEDALRVTDEHKDSIHLMLTDVVMPGMSGRKLAELLKPLYPDMKIIYMSGYTDDSIVNHGVLAKGLEFLQKPFTPEDLASKVREVLDQGIDN